MAEHVLKITPEYFDDVVSKLKRFEIRRNDRDFKVGDTLILREYLEHAYTGAITHCKVIYITDYAQKENYVVLGID